MSKPIPKPLGVATPTKGLPFADTCASVDAFRSFLAETDPMMQRSMARQLGAALGQFPQLIVEKRFHWLEMISTADRLDAEAAEILRACAAPSSARKLLTRLAGEQASPVECLKLARASLADKADQAAAIRHQLEEIDGHRAADAEDAAIAIATGQEAEATQGSPLAAALKTQLTHFEGAVAILTEAVTLAARMVAAAEMKTDAIAIRHELTIAVEVFRQIAEKFGDTALRAASLTLFPADFTMLNEIVGLPVRERDPSRLIIQDRLTSSAARTLEQRVAALTAVEGAAP